MPRNGQRLRPGPATVFGPRAQNHDPPHRAAGSGDQATGHRAPDVEVLAPQGGHPAPQLSSVERQIHARANVVKRPGKYIGFFELVTWCSMRRRNILLNMGQNWLSVDELYPGLQERTRGAETQPPIHIAGCFWDEELQTWAAIHDPMEQTLTHYVVAIPFGAPRSQEKCRSLAYQLQALGFMLIPTVAQGDCGIDALAYYDNGLIDMGPVGWQRLRNELSIFMNEHAHEEVYQERFNACQEGGGPDNDSEEDVPDLADSQEDVPDLADNDVDSDISSDSDDDAPLIGCLAKSSAELSGSAVPPVAAKPSSEEPSGSVETSGSLGTSGSVVQSVATKPSSKEPSGSVEPSGSLGPCGSVAPRVAAKPSSKEPAGSEELSGAVEPSGSKELSGALGTSSGIVSTATGIGSTSAGIASTSSGIASAATGIVPTSTEIVSTSPELESTRAGAKGGNRNFSAFRMHLGTLSAEQLTTVSSSLAAYHAYESEFFGKLCPSSAPATRNSSPTLLHARLALGRAYQKWLLTPAGQAARREKTQLRSFIVEGTARALSNVNKKETAKLTRAWHLALEEDLADGRLDSTDRAGEAALARQVVERGAKRRRGRGETEAQAVVPGEIHCARGRPNTSGRLGLANRRRLLRFQGRKHKCPALRSALCDWFLDSRTLFLKISPATVKSQAEQLGRTLFREFRGRGEWLDIPRITDKWVRGFRREYDISLRTPNMKYKLNREKLTARLSVMFATLFRIRWLAWFCLGREISAWGADQKPIYMSEGCHKNRRTLHLSGVELAVSKDIVAQSRQRISAMTVVTSLEEEASASLPLGLCFKGGSDAVLRRLPKDLGKNYFFQFAPKGSYRVEQVLEFVNWALPEWTPEREAAHDYRLLFLDAYKAHFDQAVVDAAWAHGFVVLWHGAGTTGIAQVNDTHLHAGFERIYMDMEEQSLAYARRCDPRQLGRVRADVAFDAASTWRAVDHKLAARGHKHNGLTTALDGTEDHHLSAEMSEMWTACNVREKRLKAKAEIKAKVDAGELRWDHESIQKVIGRDLAERLLGSYAQEGAELEAAQQQGQQVWEDGPDRETDDEKEDRKQSALARRVAKASSASGRPAHVINGLAVQAEASDTDAATRVAEAFASRLQQYDEMLQQAQGLHLAPFRWTLQRKKRHLLRSHVSGSPAAQAGEDLVRRYLQAKADEEAERVQEKRREIQRTKEKLAKQALVSKKLKNAMAAKKLAAAKDKERRMAEDEAATQAKALIEREFALEDLKSKGAKDMVSRQARVDFLERHRLIYGLSPDVQAYWIQFREWYVDMIVKKEPFKHPVKMKDMHADMKLNREKKGKTMKFSTWVAQTWAGRSTNATKMKI